jgi:hypothetical protein
MEPKSEKPKRRDGVTYYPAPQIRRQLKQLAVDEDTSVTALIAEAVRDLFAKRGMQIKGAPSK